MKKRILGLDTGTNSLGWAVVDKLDNGQYELIRKGSLIFQEGVKIEKGIESSKSSERSNHRALRKQYFRRRLRKIEVLKVLCQYQLCPPLTTQQLHNWHVNKEYPITDAFMEWQRTNDNKEQNPYYYRHRCLTETLNLDLQDDRYTIGRAMYHLAQRRGFLSNRLENEDNDESGMVKCGITQLSEEMATAGCEYIGEYFYQLYSKQGNKVRIRTRYTDREEHYKKEFMAICQTQKLPEELSKALERALYFQRPLKSQKQGVGRCTFEPKRPRCADSHPAYEEFRMWSTLNNIKVKGPNDVHLRSLNQREIEAIQKLFYRKSKPQFDFEEIAKELAGKNNYQYINDAGDKPYKFNYRMSQSVSGCPTCTSLRSIWGEDYARSIAETYAQVIKKDGSVKTLDEIVDDVWNALFFMNTQEQVKTFAKVRLQLEEELADKFAKIRLTHSYASLSLCAIRKILPYLKRGIKYSHAVFMANVPTIVGKQIWDSGHDYIEHTLLQLMKDYESDRQNCRIDRGSRETIEDIIIDYLSNNFDLKAGVLDRLYHPSMIDVYPDAKQNKDGIYQLGSPRTDAIRNPMAMRSLHELRKVVNLLLREMVIDQQTEVHIEYARELHDANQRKALSDWNNSRKKNRDKYRAEIKELYKENTGREIEPTETDVLKYELWEEQGHKCLYTDETIGIADFLGDNPRYDIEHTIPQSVGGDSSMMNLTLCSSKFNRDIKKAQLPSQLANHLDILVRIEMWEKKVYSLRKALDGIRTHSGMEKSVKDRLIQKRNLTRIEYDYWKGKVDRFHMTEVPEGFAMRQGAGIGLVSKYAGLYLRSLFHKPEDRTLSNVRVVKGLTTAEFRKLWGIQEEYEKKSRDNHVHHCIDAIVIACIDKAAYDKTAQYYHDEESNRWGKGSKPSFPKPWPSFTEDIKKLSENVLVAHDTPDNMPKKAKRRDVATPTGHYMAQGDSARGSLHKDTYYGAIEHNGEIRYVVRKPLASFSSVKELENIVDDAVRETILKTVEEKGLSYLKQGPVYMNKSKGVIINKVRCFTNVKPLHIRQQRDLSPKDYKQQYHVMNDSNYMLGIYEGLVKGKMKRDFEICNTLEAACHYNANRSAKSGDSVIPQEKKGLALIMTLKIGTKVILYENHPDEIDFNNLIDVSKRLYKVSGFSINPTRITLRHSHEARIDKELENKNGAYAQNETYRPKIVLLHTQIKALVEGVDFEMNALGEIKLLQ